MYKEFAVDRISSLPDDILVSIISLLTLKEATVAKIFSTRWRRLTPAISLSFPYPLEQQECDCGGYVKVADQDKISAYTSEIDRASKYWYKGSRVIKRLEADVLVGYYCDKWLEFALTRETEVIGIRLVYSKTRPRCCTYPLSTFLTNGGGQVSWPALGCLKELSLSGFHLSNQDIKLLLSNFIVLERLSIESPCPKPHLFPHIESRSLFVFEDSCKLKYLNISDFSNVSSINVYQMKNLVSLRCYGLGKYDLKIHGVPKLVDLDTNHSTNQNVRWSASIPSVFLIGKLCAQLRRLKVYTVLDREKGNNTTYLHRAFKKLKHLELIVEMHQRYSIRQLFHLIEACPFVEELVIKFLWSAKPTYRKIMHGGDWINIKAALNNLKTMRLSGYFGSASELELVLFIINNATNLKKLIVESSDTNGAIQPMEIARAFNHLRSLTPTSLNLRMI